MPADTFFSQRNCDRCHRPMNRVKTMSWFTNETICLDCAEGEDEVKQRIRAQGMNPMGYEGCGYLPTQF